MMTNKKINLWRRLKERCRYIYYAVTFTAFFWLYGYADGAERVCYEENKEFNNESNISRLLRPRIETVIKT